MSYLWNLISQNVEIYVGMPEKKLLQKFFNLKQFEFAKGPSTLQTHEI